VLVTDISPVAAHTLLAESNIRGQPGTYVDGDVIVDQSEPREALSPGVYDAMRRTIFCLDIADFVEVEDLGRAITAIQHNMADQRLNASRSDFPILSGSQTGGPSDPDPQDNIASSGAAVRPMPRRGDRPDGDDTSQEETDMDNLVDELDGMEL